MLFLVGNQDCKLGGQIVQQNLKFPNPIKFFFRKTLKYCKQSYFISVTNNMNTSFDILYLVLLNLSSEEIIVLFSPC